jgi:DNA-directed RNA polymerase subunit RPC12/RpoP
VLDPHDPWIFELCFPGAISGEAEVRCPHCNAVLTVPVEDPMGTERYQCVKCGNPFVVDRGE